MGGDCEVKIRVVIPARLGSTRFPGKPLHTIKGKALLAWVIEKVKMAKGIDQVLVATDDQKIAILCESLNIDHQMTDSSLQSGTDRVYQALKNTPGINDQDIIVNVQGDEPMIPPQWIEKLIKVLNDHPQIEMATLAHSMDWDELDNLNAVKVVMDQSGKALYFSRYPIPHSRVRDEKQKPVSLKHVGLYAFRYQSLKKFCLLETSALEISESLEQLRALQAGFHIQVITVEGAIQGVDTLEDALKVEKLL
jgi:3-deoxy-manno-octulosonate cytidylyltransferase (CMP-KDO synthetase)